MMAKWPAKSLENYYVDDNYKTYDKATLAFQKLSVREGDVIVISFPADIEPAQMQLFAEQLQPNIPEDVTILCTRGGVTIQNLPEAEMNKMGWHRFDTTKVN